MKTRLIFAFFLFSFLIGVLFPVYAGAQDNCLIKGDTIRITTKFPQINEKGFFNDEFEGRFVRFQNDTLLYENGKAIRFVPVSEIKCLEVKIGEKRDTTTCRNAGIVIGGLLFGSGYAIITYNFNKKYSPFEPNRDIQTVMSFLTGALFGAFVGKFVGASIGDNYKTPVWQKVEITPVFIANTSAANDYGILIKKIP